jgi:cell division protease FtsH
MRGTGFTGGHEEREQTLNQILAEMDGFEKNAEVIVFAATNRPEYLDPALLRPGRFDRRIILDLPDIQGREDILKIHCQDKPLAGNVKLREVAERTPGFSGADLSNLVNEAAILAARREKEVVGQNELLESIEKVLLGPERKSHLLSQKEKEISSYHEAGYALISSVLPNTEEVRKVSIFARGMAAGYTLALPKDEKRIKTKTEFLAELAVLLGGYSTEKLVFNELSTGASNDLQKASHLARALVTKYGMSKLGPIVFGKRESLPFLGWETETERDYSEKTASDIDTEIERFIKEAELKATTVLQQKRKTLEKIAKVLIEKETIEKEEFEELVGIKQQNNKNSRKPKGTEVGV